MLLNRTARVWMAHVLGALATLFLAVDSILKVLRTSPAVDATTSLGYPAATVMPIGLLETLCLVLYVMPRTSILGAVLLTGYLGGAVATHVRVGSPLFTHTLFPIYVAALVWGSLVLRDAQLAALVPFARARVRERRSELGAAARVSVR